MKLTTKLLTTIIGLAGMAGLANGQMSKEAQAAATPDSILKDLMAGNANFAAGNLTKIDMKAEPKADGIRVTGTVICTGQTGVEMEALTAVQIALLTIYDMCKAVDRGMCISDVQLLSKAGGKSGDWQRDQ